MHEPRLGPQCVPVTGERAPNTPPGWLRLARTGAWGGRYVPFPSFCVLYSTACVQNTVWDVFGLLLCIFCTE